MPKLPWMQFYPADYLLDTQPLSPLARGIWMDVICLLWRADTIGTLSHPVERWLRVLRCSETEWVTACSELSEYHICDIAVTANGNVTLISRRMCKEEKIRKATRLRVRRYRSNKASNTYVQDCNQENQNQSHISESEVRKNQSQKESESEKEKKKIKSSSEVMILAGPTGVETWNAYALGFRRRYGVDPVRNAKVNGMLKRLVQRLGESEAPQVAAFYCTHCSAAYVRAKHCVELLLRDAEGLRMEWATGRQITNGTAQQTDRTSTTGQIIRELIAEKELKHV